jgi:AcrR family transcriptional regulator
MDEPTVRERLLDATLYVAEMHGISRLSVGDVAKRAGLSRQTLYKHFASRDELVANAVMREAGRMVEQVIAASAGFDDPEQSLQAAILEMLRLARTHPLLDRLVATEPEALLPLLIDGRGSVLAIVRDIAQQILVDRMDGVPERAAGLAADILSRTLVSYAVRPPDASPEATAQFLASGVVSAVRSVSEVPEIPTSPRP